MIAGFIQDGTAALFALAVIAIELFALVRLTRGRPGWPVGGLVANAASGACLMVALWAALTERGPATIGVLLVLSLVAHAFDLALRLRRSP